MRQIILDTETTGLSPNDGHRIIEIGAVELVDRKLTGKHYHQYINPLRPVEDSVRIHGLTDDYLQDFPVFGKVVEDFLRFVDGAELVIHNASFDMAFLEHELSLLSIRPTLAERCAVVDSLQLAKEKFPGGRVSLDALCKRFGVDNSNRQLHGALLDAQLLTEVYLQLTGGQFDFGFDDQQQGSSARLQFDEAEFSGLVAKLLPVQPSPEEIDEHRAFLQAMSKKSDLIWRADAEG